MLVFIGNSREFLFHAQTAD